MSRRRVNYGEEPGPDVEAMQLDLNSSDFFEKALALL